jgi:hypothetical protein
MLTWKLMNATYIFEISLLYAFNNMTITRMPFIKFCVRYAIIENCKLIVFNFLHAAVQTIWLFEFWKWSHNITVDVSVVRMRV